MLNVVWGFGDNLSIKDGVVMINNEPLKLHDRQKLQYSYKVAIDGKTPINFEYLLKELNITDPAGQIAKDTLIFSALTDEGAQVFRNTPGVTGVTKVIDTKGDTRIFPHTKPLDPGQYGTYLHPASR